MSRRRFSQDLNSLLNAQTRLQRLYEEERAFRRAQATEWLIAHSESSGKFGESRLADEFDLQQAGLLSGRGLVIGGFNGKIMTYNGDGSLITLLRAGGGKNTSFIFPNLAYVTSRSLVIMDIKEGENAYSSAEFRAEKLGNKCIYLNPFGLHDLPNTKINPFQSLIDLYKAGKAIDSEYEELAEIIIPTPKTKSSNSWVYSGAQQIIAWILNYLLIDDDANLSLGWIWRFANSGGQELANFFSFMKVSSDETVASRAHRYDDMALNAPKEWAAYISEIAKAISNFKPNTSLEISTRVNEFDFANLKKEPYSIYVILPASKIEACAKWIGLIVNHIIETVAAASGEIRTTIILDELPQYYAPAIPKALRLYRGRGINLWMFSQSRQSLYDRWSKDLVAEFEDQAAVSIYKNVTEPQVLKDLEYWSGNKTILNRNLGHNAGVSQAGSSGLNETKRNVLQAEDILSLNRDQHIVRVSNMPRLIVADTIPYYEVPEWKAAIKDVREMHAKGSQISRDKKEGNDE
ncbi:MAG: type IV secretory system conjugative DNA transfer family protein [Proteobacteria bacterium]|nr:type IV secretory system conjugative DNA transfer family protein [Pseudomonadota bacterium]